MREMATITFSPAVYSTPPYTSPGEEILYYYYYINPSAWPSVRINTHTPNTTPGPRIIVLKYVCIQDIRSVIVQQHLIY